MATALLLWGLAQHVTQAADPLVVQRLHAFEHERPTGIAILPDGTILGTTAGSNVERPGRIFRATPRGWIQTLAVFEGDLGNDPSGLTPGLDGSLYVTTTFGSTTLGAVHRIRPNGTRTTLVAFEGPNGARPWGTLLQASDGTLYGTTTSGGRDGAGTVFRLHPDRDDFSVLFSFSSPTGSQPLGGLVEARDGSIYGATSLGRGVLFHISPTGEYRSLAGLDSVTGYGWCFLAKGSDNTLVGTCQAGGTADLGTFFRVGTDDRIGTVVSFSREIGSFPMGVLQDPDGAFIGVCRDGGPAGHGTVFRVDPAAGLQRLASFDTYVGSQPARLVRAPDGYYYGIASRGGDRDSGTLFRLVGRPKLTTRRSPDGSWIATWNAIPGTTYRLERSEAAAGTVWESVDEITARDDAVEIRQRFLASRSGFFRVRLLP